MKMLDIIEKHLPEGAELRRLPGGPQLVDSGDLESAKLKTERYEQMTTKETAAEIRKALKAQGWNSRKVSVKVRHLGVDSAIDVTVRDPGIPLSAVREIAEQHRHVDRCSATGEILLGGNLYVDAAYSREALAPTRAEMLAKLEAEAIGPGVQVDLGNGLWAWKCQEHGYYWLKRDGWELAKKIWSADYTAKLAAIEILDPTQGE